MEKTMNNLGKLAKRVCGALEIIAAILILIGIVLSVISFIRDVSNFGMLLDNVNSLQLYLEKIFVIVIGIEFLQMLCRPNSGNIMEILIFLVARHMIVGTTTPVEDFVSVISIALLCVVRGYLRNAEKKEASEEE